jgi:hypothetical protein
MHISLRGARATGLCSWHKTKCQSCPDCAPLIMRGKRGKVLATNTNIYETKTSTLQNVNFYVNNVKDYNCREYVIVSVF